MEEISPDRMVEQEIRDDARKRAERALRQAEKDVADMESAHEERLLEEEALGKAKEKSLAEAYRRELFARLPLEKKRLELSWADQRLNAALRASLATRAEAAAAVLILPRALKAVTAFKGSDVLFRAQGMGGGEKMLLEALKASGARVRPLESQAEAPGMAGVWMEKADASLHFSLSMDAAAEDLLDACRGELYEALLGGEGGR